MYVGVCISAGRGAVVKISQQQKSSGQTPRAKKNHNIIITHADNCTKLATKKPKNKTKRKRKTVRAPDTPLAKKDMLHLSRTLALSRPCLTIVFVE